MTGHAKPKRMTISLGPKDKANLEFLTDEQDITQSEALRRAIATEVFVQKAQENGDLILLEKDGSKKQVVFR